MVLRRLTRARALTAVVAFALIPLAIAACSNASGGSKEATDTASKTPATTFKGTDYSKNVPVQAQGVTPTEIRVASITSKTNPIGGDNARLNDGLKAYFAKVNANHGIWGRKITLVNERDDQTGNNATE